MSKPKCYFRMFTESGTLIALAVAMALLVGIVGPAAAQFFNFGDFGGQRQQPQRGGGGWFGNDLFAPFQQQVPWRQPSDFSTAGSRIDTRSLSPSMTTMASGFSVARIPLAAAAQSAGSPLGPRRTMEDFSPRRIMEEDARAKLDAKPADAKSGTKPDGTTDAAAKPDDKAVDTELSPDAAASMTYFILYRIGHFAMNASDNRVN